MCGTANELSQQFKVVITEILKMTVEIEANNPHEAEQKAFDNWRDGQYILDADHFAGVEFEATPIGGNENRKI